MLPDSKTADEPATSPRPPFAQRIRIAVTSSSTAVGFTPDAQPANDVTPRNRSLAQALDGHHNSLGVIRLLLACAVIVHHSVPLMGLTFDPIGAWAAGQATLGTIAVAGFFAISGYLVTKSGMSSDVLRFLWRRVIRIFPAFWTVLLVTAFVIAPVLWILLGRTIGSYFVDNGAGPFSYFGLNWTLQVGTYGIHDLLTSTTPYGRTVMTSVFNGSTWTLSYEWACYLVVAGLVLFGVLTRAKIVVPILTALLLLAQGVDLAAPGTLVHVVPFLNDPWTVTLTFTFMMGAVLALYSKSIPLTDGLGLGAGALFFLTMHFGGFLTIGVVAGAYFVLYCAVRLPRRIQWVGQRNDYSYGIYLWGFPVQQLLAYSGLAAAGLVVFTLASLVIAAACAWLSWHLVEKHAMRLKDWGPGRGLPSIARSARAVSARALVHRVAGSRSRG